jgi:hypothetical protein
MSLKEIPSAKYVQVTVCAALLILGSGCDRGWREYQQIAIGAPLSKDLLLVREGRDHGKDQVRVWGEFACSNIPPVLGWDSVGVLLDAEGRVIAKRYIAVAVAHWGLLQTLSARSVMDIQVLPQTFGELPPTTSDTHNPPTTLCGYLKLVEENLPIALTKGQDERLVDCFNTGTALVLHKPLHCAITRVSPFALGKGESLISEHLYAMDKDPKVGCSTNLERCPQVKNRGGHRIRIEANWFRIVDPLGIALRVHKQPQLRIYTPADCKPRHILNLAYGSADRFGPHAVGSCLCLNHMSCPARPVR